MLIALALDLPDPEYPVDLLSHSPLSPIKVEVEGKWGFGDFSGSLF
jgi:hypothetical protein